MNKPYIVDHSYEGIRIDKWIRNNLGNVPQGLIEKSLRTGKIKLNNSIVDDMVTKVEPQKRNIGIIFQDLALFPHLNCKDNILFGISKNCIDQKLNRLDGLNLT